MNISIKKELVKSSETIFTAESTLINEADIIVPDTKGDLSHILQISGTPQVENCDVQGDKVIISGSVEYTILYKPEDGDGKVEAIFHSHPFTDVCEGKDEGCRVCAHVDAELVGIDYNIINTRKINLRGTVALTVTAVCTREVEVPTDVSSDIPIEIKKQQIDTFSVVADSDIICTFPDKFVLPAGKAPITELLKVDAEVTGQDVKIITGKAIIKGIARVCILYKSDESTLPADYYEHEFPFTEILDLPEITEDMDCSVKYVPLSAYCEVDSASGEVGVEATVSVRMFASRPISVSVMEDCFSPKYHLAESRTDYKFEKILKNCTQSASIKQSVTLPDGCPPIMQIYRVMTKPFVENVSREGNASIISGTVDAYILYLSSASDMPLYSFKAEVPFSISANDCSFDDGAGIECDAVVDGCTFSQAGEFSAEICVTVSATLKIYSSCTTHIIDSISADDNALVPESCITVYFVQGGDTLWDIAKRYNAPSDKICAANKLPENCPLMPGTPLLIPYRGASCF